MNHRAVLGLGFLLLGRAAPASSAPFDPPILPTPHQARFEAGSLDLSPGVRIFIPAKPGRLREIAEILRDGLAGDSIPAQITPYEEKTGYHLVFGKSASGIEAEAPGPASPAIPIALSLAAQKGSNNPEAYELKTGDSVEITAPDPRGLLWGVQTLLQGIEGKSLRKGEVIDEPDRAWRALMLDPARSFLDLDFLRRTIRVMSAYKLNVLNLHMIDDQAWRFESKWFPKCNRPGEPFYSQAELRALSDYARRFGIDLIPEIDFPGHVQTAVAAYPDLDCEGRVRPLNQAILCPGKPFTWIFIDRVIEEVASVFPSKYIEVGADEPFAIREWENCPACRERMREKGVTTLPAFYHTVVTDIDATVRRHGKTMIACDDAITPGVDPMPPRDLLIQAWVDYDRSAGVAAAGYPIINATNHPLYLSSMGLRAGNPLPTVYAWNPTLFAPPGIRREAQTIAYRPLPPQTRILGGEASIWGTEELLAERRLYPRLLAVADALWSERHRESLRLFEARLRQGQIARLRRLGVPDESALPVEMPFRDLGGNDPWIVSPRDYADFILTCEQRTRIPTEQSGIWIRCAGNEPRGYTVYTLPPNGWIVSPRFYLPGKWNRFELTARGRIVSLTINDGLAWSQIDPSPESGRIILGGRSGGFEFRNVRVRILPPGFGR